MAPENVLRYTFRSRYSHTETSQTGTLHAGRHLFALWDERWEAEQDMKQYEEQT